jgi:hypothetical protein
MDIDVQSIKDEKLCALHIARGMRVLYLRYGSISAIESINPHGVFVSANGTLAIRIPGTEIGGFEEQRYSVKKI